MARNKLNIMRSDPIEGQEWRREWNDQRLEKGFHMMFSTHNVVLDRSLFTTRPELFALVHGKRNPAQACWSHPEFKQIMIERFSKIYEEYPSLEILSLFPADNTNYCQCPKCDKQRLTDHWFSFYKELMAGIQAKHPKLSMSSIAYQSYREVPVTDLTGLAFVEYCMYDRCYVHKFSECKINDIPLKRLAEWQKKGIPMGIYGYEFNIFRDKYHTPFYSMLSDEMRKFRDLGIMSVITEAVPLKMNEKLGDLRQYNHCRLAYYIYAALLWNPDADITALIKDYSLAAFGTAGKDMADYFLMMAKSWEALDLHYSHYFASPLGCAEKFISPKLIADANAAFEQARHSISGIADATQRNEILRQIGIEEKVFNVWVEMYKKQMAIKRNQQLVIPRAVRPGDFSNATPIPPFNSEDGRKFYPTDVSVNWDNNALYLKAICHDPAMEKIIAKNTEHDSPVWTEDCFEVFLGIPNDSRGLYRHFIVNTLGARYDAVGLGGKNFTSDWNADWSVNVKKNAANWTLELVIPFKALDLHEPPKDGDTWSFALKRSNGGERQDYVHSGFPNAPYHDYNAFANIRFSDAADIRSVLFYCKASARFMEQMKAEAAKLNFDMATINEEAELPPWLDNYKVIVIRYPDPQSRLKPEFYPDFFSKQLLSALQNGAIVLFSSYGGLPMEKMFGMDELRLRWSGWKTDPARKTYDIMPGKWLTEPSDIEKLLRDGMTPGNGYLPVYPEGWNNLASLRMENGSKFSFLLTRKIGKGMLVVTSGDFGTAGGKSIFGLDKSQSMMLINNLYEWHKNEK